MPRSGAVAYDISDMVQPCAPSIAIERPSPPHSGNGGSHGDVRERSGR